MVNSSCLVPELKLLLISNTHWSSALTALSALSAPTMYSIISQVGPALSFVVIPFLLAGPARATPINNGHVFTNDELPSSKYDQLSELTTIDYQKRGQPAALLDGQALAPQLRKKHADEIVKKREEKLYVNLPRALPSDVEDGSETNVLLHPRKRWGGGWGGNGCCGRGW